MASYQRMTCAVFFLSSFAVLNVFLYASLLPLWEGFDEPFHFGYVQYVANQWKFPDVRTTHLSEEVAESLLLTPASIYVQRNVPAVQTYSDYFSMSVEQRRHQRTQLYQVPTIARGKESKFLNYEAHHAPMAYALLAGPERALAFMPLVQRVLVLRIVAGLTGALFLYWGMHQLFVNLALPSTFRLAAIFCIFCSQMTWATIAHVTNDWLAFPLTTCTLVMLIRYRRNPTLSVGVQLAAVLTGGLLTKSYFLAFLPVLAITVCWAGKLRPASLVIGLLMTIAGPWYWRNLNEYGVMSGMQEARSGIGFAEMVNVESHLDWFVLSIRNARWALWTGNNSFLTFSTWTLNGILIMLLCR